MARKFTEESVIDAIESYTRPRLERRRSNSVGIPTEARA